MTSKKVTVLQTSMILANRELHMLEYKLFRLSRMSEWCLYCQLSAKSQRLSRQGTEKSSYLKRSLGREWKRQEVHKVLCV